MRAAVYLRQSLDRTGEMLAIARQRKACLQLCRERGWTPVEYVDNDVSASKKRQKRPDFERMLVDIDAGQVDAVVTWDLDRLYRQPTDLERLIDLAEDRGLLLATITGDADLATDNGRLYARIKAAVARSEVERKSARQKLGHQQRAEKGIPWGDRRTFGFTDDHRLQLAEASRVDSAYLRVIAGGSLMSIAKDWNAAGLTTTLGNRWRGPGLSRLLRNPKMAGLIAHKGVIVGKGQWPAIVSEDVWRTAQAVMSNPSRNPRPGSRTRKYLLSGIAACGRCTGRMSGSVSSRGVVAYKCQECSRLSRNRIALDEFIVDLVVKRLGHEDAGDLVVDRSLPDLDRLQSEAANFQKRMEGLTIQYVEGAISEAQMKAGTKRLRELQEANDAAMSDATKAQVFAGIIGSTDVRAAFDLEPLDRQRAIVHELMRITVMPSRLGPMFDPESVRVEWKS